MCLFRPPPSNCLQVTCEQTILFLHTSFSPADGERGRRPRNPPRRARSKQAKMPIILPHVTSTRIEGKGVLNRYSKGLQCYCSDLNPRTICVTAQNPALELSTSCVRTDYFVPAYFLLARGRGAGAAPPQTSPGGREASRQERQFFFRTLLPQGLRVKGF